MRVLLTGGAGYVGSACLRHLRSLGADVVCYDDLSAGNREAIDDAPLVEGDIRDTERLAAALREHRCEAVLHFAALASVPESIAEPDRYWSVNVEGTRSVLEAMRDVDVRAIVLSSTAATFAFDQPMPLVEDSAQNPETPYGTTKLAAERLIADYGRAFGLSSTALRYFNAAGADPDGRHGESRAHETHLIPLVFAAALGRRDRLQVCGTDWPTRDGTCVRDYVHVLDLAEAHRLALEAMLGGAEPSQRVYNLGSGEGTSVLEVVAACERALGRPVPREDAPRRPGDPATLVASSTRIREELGWTPRFPRIDDVVATAWRWHERFPDGYRTPAGAAGG